MAKFSAVSFTIMLCVMAGELVSSTHSFGLGLHDGLDTGIGGLESRNRVKRAAGDCRGGSGRYITYWNTDMSNSPLANSVEDCFRSLKLTAEENRNSNLRWDCNHASSSSGCRCTYDSSYIFSFDETFSKAYENLRRTTSNFESIEAERHEGNMYLSYICPKSASTYTLRSFPMEEGSQAV